MIVDTLDEVRLAQCATISAQSDYEYDPTIVTRMLYETQLNKYRDLCTVIVEKLMQENPQSLKGIKLWEEKTIYYTDIPDETMTECDAEFIGIEVPTGGEYNEQGKSTERIGQNE